MDVQTLSTDLCFSALRRDSPGCRWFASGRWATRRGWLQDARALEFDPEGNFSHRYGCTARHWRGVQARRSSDGARESTELCLSPVKDIPLSETRFLRRAWRRTRFYAIRRVMLRCLVLVLDLSDPVILNLLGPLDLLVQPGRRRRGASKDAS